MRRYRSVMVSIDADDVLSELDDKEILEELKARRVTVPDALGNQQELRERISIVLELNTSAEAFRMLREILVALSPDCDADLRKKYEAAKATRDPVTKQPVIQ